MQRTRTHRLTLVAVLAALTSVASGLQTQEDAASDSSQTARIIWKKAFDGGIEHRNYFGGRSAEPDVGISPDTTRATPVRMVASSKGVYLLDAAGHVERIVSVRREPWPEGRDPKTEPMEIINEYAMTDPNGEFYVILESHSNGLTAGVGRLRAFNVDGTLRFELVGSELYQSDPPRWLAELLDTYISPSGDYLVLFESGWGDLPFQFLDVYDTRTGALIRNIDDAFFRTNDFDPLGLGFSEDGTRIILNGFKTDDLLEFDARGQFLRRIKGGATSQKAKTARQTREAMKRALEPKAVKARLARGHILSGVAEFGLLRNRSRGIYARGDTLCLFELTGRQSEERASPHSPY